MNDSTHDNGTLPQEFSLRLAEVERRLAEVERRLASESRAGVAAGAVPIMPEAVVPAKAAIPATAGPPPLPVRAPGLAAPVASVEAAAAPPELPVATAVAPPHLPSYEPRPGPAPAPVQQGSIEQTIGLKWAGWVGAVILVIAAGLGIKFAYDQGWFGGIPAVAKLAVLWVGALGLIGLGEWVYRRVNRLSAAGLFGAGVAMLFLVSYAGYGFLGVYDRGAAFVLMAASTVAGALVAMRGRMVSVAVLALVGGNLAPILLGGAADDLKPFFGYLLMLQLTALVLAWWGGTARWWTLRGLSLATTAVWAAVGTVAAWESPARVDPRTWPLAFVLGFAALYQLELILSGLRRGASAQPRTGAVFSLMVTALLAAGVTGIFHESSGAVRGTWVAGIAAGCAVLGFVCRGLSLRALAISFAVQAAVLVVVAVPLAFSGWAVTAGWAALAVAFAAIGAALDLNVPRRAAAVTFGLCIAYFVGWLADHWTAQQALRLAAIGETVIPQFLGVAAGLAAVGHLVAAILPIGLKHDRDRREFAVWQALTQAAAGVFWVATSIAALPPLGATVAIVAYAWACAGLDLLRPSLRLAWHAAGAVAVAMVKWVVVDLVTGRLAADGAAAPLVLNPVMGVGGLIAASLVAIGWLGRRAWVQESASGRGQALALAIAVLGLMTIGLSAEVSRGVDQLLARGAALAFSPAQTRMLGWTLLWSAAGAALIGLVRRLGSARPAAVVGTIVAGLLAAKFVLFDTLGFRLGAAPSTAAKVGANVQVLTGMALFGLGLLALWMYQAPGARGTGGRGLLAVVLALIPWFVVSVEIDRWAETQGIAAPWMARQVGWSVWWSVYAIGMVIAGFRLRTAAARYAGLALFAVTLLKVVIVDLSAASTGLRILSFFGLGVLLLATSVLYGKLSPKLLNTDGRSG